MAVCIESPGYIVESGVKAGRDYKISVRLEEMLSPCSILSNNISVVGTLRMMLETQIKSQKETPVKAKIRARLLSLRSDSNLIKSQLVKLRSLVRESTFQNLVPKEFNYLLSRQACKPSLVQSPFDNKQNEQTNNKTISSISKFEVVSQKDKMENKSLRSRIFKDLADLKKIEQTENILRELSRPRVNRNGATESKRRPYQKPYGGTDTRSVSHCSSRDQTFVTEESLDSHITQSIVVAIQDSQITVPSLVKPNTKSLKCPDNHEYFNGQVLNGLPHHKGRLFSCCDKIPFKLPEGTMFYNGGFNKGNLQGYGTLTFKNGTKFVGMFRDGLRHGDGSIYYKGSVEMGRWDRGRLCVKL